MSREDFLAQKIRNIESDRECLINILVDLHFCPMTCEMPGIEDFCKSNSDGLCGTPPEECWQEIVRRKRPPETYIIS